MNTRTLLAAVLVVGWVPALCAAEAPPGDAVAQAARLASEDAAERETAVAAIAALGPAAIPAVLDSIEGHILIDPEQWLDATVKALQGIGRPGAAHLGRALADPRQPVAMIAASVLVKLGRDAEPALADLARALGSETPMVAGDAERALTAIGAPAVAPIAEALRGSREARARASVLWSRDPAARTVVAVRRPATAPGRRDGAGSRPQSRFVLSRSDAHSPGLDGQQRPGRTPSAFMARSPDLATWLHLAAVDACP